MQELIEKVEQWAIDKGIDTADSWKPQFNKIVEEVGEFKKELEISSAYENYEEEMVEMGDIMVTLIIMTQQRGYDLYDCLAMAYAKIKDRKGEVIDGTFVKAEDIGKIRKGSEDIGKLECSLGG